MESITMRNIKFLCLILSLTLNIIVCRAQDYDIPDIPYPETPRKPEPTESECSVDEQIDCQRECFLKYGYERFGYCKRSIDLISMCDCLPSGPYQLVGVAPIITEQDPEQIACQRQCCPQEVYSSESGCTCGSNPAPRGDCACTASMIAQCTGCGPAETTVCKVGSSHLSNCGCIPNGSGQAMGTCQRHCCPYVVVVDEPYCQCNVNVLAPEGTCNCLQGEIDACQASCGSAKCTVDLDSMLCGCYEGQTPAPETDYPEAPTDLPCTEDENNACHKNCLLQLGDSATHAYEGCTRSSDGVPHCLCQEYQG